MFLCYSIVSLIALIIMSGTSLFSLRATSDFRYPYTYLLYIGAYRFFLLPFLPFFMSRKRMCIG